MRDTKNNCHHEEAVTHYHAADSIAREFIRIMNSQARSVSPVKQILAPWFEFLGTATRTTLTTKVYVLSNGFSADRTKHMQLSRPLEARLDLLCVALFPLCKK